MEENINTLPHIPELQFFKKGKVRDIFSYNDKFLMVASDRISCFDVVLPTRIPSKGAVLTQLSTYWFRLMEDIIPNHLITSNIEDFPQDLAKHSEVLRGRSMLVKKAKPIPIECVVRGYLGGSGWKEYQKDQSICGIKLPAGLREADKLPEPVFTPATKEDEGHDINVTMEYVEGVIGKETAAFLQEVSIALYTRASQYAETKNIIIADTKFEFGWFNDKIILIDEVLTPDSSRFWPMENYAPGQSPPSLDKQYVRDYLLTLDWDKTYPGPDLPDQVVQETRKKYFQVYELLTGQKLNF